MSGMYTEKKKRGRGVFLLYLQVDPAGNSSYPIYVCIRVCICLYIQSLGKTSMRIDKIINILAQENFSYFCKIKPLCNSLWTLRSQLHWKRWIRDIFFQVTKSIFVIGYCYRTGKKFSTSVPQMPLSYRVSFSFQILY